MKLAVILLASLALLSACTTPQTAIDPQNVPPVSQNQTSLQPEKTTLTKLSPVIQITDYFLVTNGDKTVALNGKEFSVSWRLINNYDYDAQNRLIRQQTKAWNNASWWEELSYRYTPDLIERYRNSENKDFENTLLLNDKGFLKGNLGPGEYVYDSDGYLITYKGNGQQDTYTIRNGNVITKETVYSSGLVQKNTYEYDLTKPAIPSPLTFRGQQSQNLLTKQTLISTASGSSASDTRVFTIYYNFDSQGRPVREFVITNGESTPSSIREYTYQ